MMMQLHVGSRTASAVLLLQMLMAVTHIADLLSG